MHGDFTKGNIQGIDLYEGRTVAQIADKPSEHDFEQGAPVVLKVEFQTAEEEQHFAYEAQNSSGEVVRKGTFPISKPEGAEGLPTVTRYVAVVSSKKNSLPAGKYKFIINNKDGKAVSQRTFEIKG
jgi:hypothetical protein